MFYIKFKNLIHLTEFFKNQRIIFLIKKIVFFSYNNHREYHIIKFLMSCSTNYFLQTTHLLNDNRKHY